MCQTNNQNKQLNDDFLNVQRKKKLTGSEIGWEGYNASFGRSKRCLPHLPHHPIPLPNSEVDSF